VSNSILEVVYQTDDWQGPRDVVILAQLLIRKTQVQHETTSDELTRRGHEGERRFMIQMMHMMYKSSIIQL
jgi:hypothetical protein